MMVTPVTDSTAPTQMSVPRHHVTQMPAVPIPMVVSLAHATRAMPVTVSHAPTLTSAPHHRAMPTPAVTIPKDSVDSYLPVLPIFILYFMIDCIFNYYQTT